MKYVFLLSLTIYLNACATKSAALFSETMLPDGKTWEIRTKIDCEDIKHSSAKCKDRLRETVTIYGTELCGESPKRVFACAVRGNDDYTISGNCYVKCP